MWLKISIYNSEYLQVYLVYLFQIVKLDSWVDMIKSQPNDNE